MLRQGYRQNVRRVLSAFTRPVRDHVHDRLDLTFEDLGALNLKNIARPVEAFVLRFGAATDRLRLRRRSLIATLTAAVRRKLSLPDKPSIAVLPVREYERRPGAGVFRRGFAEDVITLLSRIARTVRHRPQLDLHLQKPCDRCENGRP